MRYRASISKTKNIFWTKNSTDKPSLLFFNQILEGIIWESLGEITPTWINQFNGQIVTGGDDYTYLKLTDEMTGKDKFYFVDSVNKVLNNGVCVLDITLDVFATYSYHLYDQIKNSYPFKINRCNNPEIYKHSQDGQVTPDPLLSLNYPLQFFRYTQGPSEYITNINSKETTPDGFKFTYAKINNNVFSYKSPAGSVRSIYINNHFCVEGNVIKILNLPLWDVYQTADGYIYYFPIFDCEYWSKSTQNSSTFYMEFWESGQTNKQKAENLAEWVDYLKNNTHWVNHYQGRFIIPFWNKLIQNCGAISIALEGAPVRDRVIIGFFHKVGIKNTQEYWTPRLNFLESEEITFNNLVRRDAYKDIHWYLIREIKTINDTYNIGRPWANNPLHLFNGNYSLSPWAFKRYEEYNFMFSTSGFQYFKPDFIKYDYAISGMETLPISTNSYIQYLSSVQSSQNTGLQVAKQQSIINGVQGGLNSVFGAVGSFMSGNILGGVSSLVNGGFGVAKNVLQYENKKRMLDAQNADKERSATANKFQASNRVSNYHNGFNKRVQYNIGWYPLYKHDGIFLMAPKAHTTQLLYLNSVVWESGYYCDLNRDETTPLPNSFFEYEDYPFVYWDITLNPDYVKRIYPSLNNELIEAITLTINNPVRFWRQTPDYNIGYFSIYELETQILPNDEIEEEIILNEEIQLLPYQESEENEKQETEQ